LPQLVKVLSVFEVKAHFKKAFFSKSAVDKRMKSRHSSKNARWTSFRVICEQQGLKKNFVVEVWLLEVTYTA
jgi:hypothetical protein